MTQESAPLANDSPKGVDMLNPRYIIPALLIALLALTSQATIASAHEGHEHPNVALATPEGRQVAADAATNERLEREARAAAPDAVRGECVQRINVPGQGPSCLDANGEWLVELADGKEIATHGGDRVLAGTVFGTIPTSNSTDAALAAAGPADVSCTSNPRVPHYRLIYSRASDAPDRSGVLTQALRSETYKASAVMNEQAQRTAPGVSRKLRVWCSGGIPVVDVVQLSIDNNNDNFAAIVSQLRSRGYNSPEPQVARYLVYHDGVVGDGFGFGGQASSTDSSSSDPYSANNAANYYAIDYADAEGVPNWHTVLHETMHTMGAVQNTAPDANGFGHCRTDHDVMCYAENGVSTYLACPFLQLDCGDNTYFNAGSPVVGSYLATSWNAAKPINRYVDHGAQTIDYTKPSAPTSLAHSGVTFSTVNLTWTASIDDVGVSAYRVETSASPFGPFVTNSESPSTSRTVTGLTPGATTYIRVRAVDARSQFSDPTQVVVTTQVDNTAPSQPATFTSSGHSESGFTLAWSASADNDEVAAYVLERFNGNAWTTIATITAPGTIYDVTGQAANTSFDLSIRARDRAGNLSIRRTHATNTSPDATAPAAPGGVLASGGVNNIGVSWSHASDPSGISRYEVDVSNAFGVVAATNTTGNLIGFTVTGGITYTVRVRAVDTAGNASEYGTSSAFVTAPAPPPPPYVPPVINPPVVNPTPLRDLTRPSRPTLLKVASRTRTSARITWRRSTDNVGLRGYRVYLVTATGRWVLRATLNQPAATAFTIGKLRANTTYRIGIMAVDKAGNSSLRSVIVRTVTSR